MKKEDEQLLTTISIMAAVMVSRYSSAGGAGDHLEDHEAKHAVGRARTIYNEAIDQLWPEQKEASPTGGETTPPFKGPVVGAGWSDENLTEESGYHK